MLKVSNKPFTNAFRNTIVYDRTPEWQFHLRSLTESQSYSAMQPYIIFPYTVLNVHLIKTNQFHEIPYFVVVAKVARSV
jgi:hypothetical protein